MEGDRGMKYKLKHKDYPLYTYKSETARDMLRYISNTINDTHSWIVEENGSSYNAETWVNTFKEEIIVQRNQTSSTRAIETAIKNIITKQN